ncbi:GGDEF domain-containing protein [Carboxydochorda subterranea]|uniref:GGDEF domain-containing protein n=1 Tax=Carboxydichorda subterranea TaxID=3109565 RepID=A0ABZ1BWN9_9FIRM|nr:GGDEF domain-containing protein [Limnochorda sp. L945t]WRP17209.1 GGDEF domain-containing protein [Limnochorda sp. L945t]
MGDAPTAPGAQLPSLRTFYQPIVRLRDGTVAGYEALTRGPEGSAIESAASLFAWARASGRLWEVDAASRRLAIHRWAELVRKALPRAEGSADGPSPRLFLNVHPLSLSEPGFRQGLTRQWVDAARLPLEAVVLELTEAASLDEGRHIEGAIRHYRRQGFAIGIDDMGAGHSSLQSLLTLKPDFVKIDRSLIDHVDQDPMRQHLVRGIVEAAHSASIQVVAEGIERLEELRFLVRAGVDMGQGFLLARPQPVPPPVSPESLAELRAAQRIFLGTGHAEPPVGELAESVPPVEPDCQVTAVLQRFEQDPGLSAVAVVEHGHPVGLVMRDRLFYLLGRRYGRAIFSARPVRLAADPVPLVVDGSTPLSEVAYRATQRQESSAYDSIIVTDDGRYQGLVTVRRLLQRITQLQIEAARDANPLTGLPGNRVIEREVARRLEHGADFSVLYCDIDDFKAFNDHYDFKRGDQAIRALAEVLQAQAARFPPGESFVGHVGGDDFVMVVPGDSGPEVARAVVEAFDSRVRLLYSPEDLARGYIEGEDRRGNRTRFGIMTLSIAILHNPRGHVRSYLEFVSNVGQLKRKAKIQEGNAIVM